MENMRKNVTDSKAGQDLSLPASDLPSVWGISGDFLTWYQTGVV